MPRRNLAQLARDNEEALRERYEEMLASHSSPEQLKELYAACEPKWSISINCWAFQLLFFLEQNVPYNKYRYVHYQEGKVFLSKEYLQAGETSVDWSAFWDVLQRDSTDAKYAPLRKVFNNWADREEDYSYGAYFVDGDGAKDFGEFSMVLKVDVVREMKEISFLTKDSLKDYLKEISDQSGNWFVEGSRIQEDAATVATVTNLMCLKISEMMETQDLEACKKSICTKEDYLEGQIVEHFTVEAMEIVRVVKPDVVKLQRLTDLAVQGRINLGDDQLTLEEQRTRDFQKSLAGLKHRNVKFAYL